MNEGINMMMRASTSLSIACLFLMVNKIEPAKLFWVNARQQLRKAEWELTDE